MARIAAFLATTALVITATVATAQTYDRQVVIEPVTNQDLSGVVRAQHIRPGDVSAEEYARLLEEADRVKAWRASQGISENVIYSGTSATSTTVYSPDQTYVSVPNYSTTTYVETAQPKIEIFDAPISSSVTYASTTPTTTYDSYSSSISSYSVSRGDTLYSIAKRYGVSLASLKSANGLSGNNIGLGQRLSIPAGGTVVVNEGTSARARTTLVRNVEPIPGSGIYAVLPKDTLYSISRYACVDVNDLMAVNGIIDATNLRPGTRLTMPANHCLR